MSKEWREIGFGGSETTDLKKSVPGTFLEGQYLGNRTITTSLGDNKVYIFSGSDGDEFSVYGFTDLDQKLAQVNVGTEVRMTYEGKVEVKTKRGPTQMHRVRVQVA